MKIEMTNLEFKEFQKFKLDQKKQKDLIIEGYITQNNNPFEVVKCIGKILNKDIGKKYIIKNGITKVENDGQFKKRLELKKV